MSCTELQELLCAYDAEPGRDSYVEEFWSDAYLAPDTGVVLNLNPFFLLEQGPDNKTSGSQTGRAASLVFSSLKFISLLKSERLPPDNIKGEVPLCMDQFNYIFGSARIPKKNETDFFVTDPNSTHVVVLYKSVPYYFRAMNEDGSVGVDENGIQKILQAIISDANFIHSHDDIKHHYSVGNTGEQGGGGDHGSGPAGSDPKGAPHQPGAPPSQYESSIGVLTTTTRGNWAEARSLLVRHSPEHNLGVLRIIDSALFVLVLDDYAPKDISDAASNCLHGSYKLSEKKNRDGYNYQTGTSVNRWYDKLQLIVCSDGSAGVNFEHSAIDGHTALRFVSDIFADTVVRFAQSITKTIYSTKENVVPSLLDADIKIVQDNNPSAMANSESGTDEYLDTTPKRLKFDLDQGVVSKIFHAETALGDEILASDVYALEFEKYGKGFITQNKMSPDSFVQMSIIMAYYKLYGKVVCCYEPVLTKRFLHGRTEAMRSLTKQAESFCKTWSSKYASHSDKLRALQAAVAEHSRQVKVCSAGKGIDRHLYSLKCIADANGIETEFFKDDGWKTLNHTILSTSNCGNPSLRLFGFGPVVPDGFGIGYIIRDAGLQYTISSKHRQTKRFADTLESFLLEFRKVTGTGRKISIGQYTETTSNRGSVSSPAYVPIGAGRTGGEGGGASGGYLENFDDFYGESAVEIKAKADADAQAGKVPKTSTATAVATEASVNTSAVTTPRTVATESTERDDGGNVPPTETETETGVLPDDKYDLEATNLVSNLNISPQSMKPKASFRQKRRTSIDISILNQTGISLLNK